MMPPYVHARYPLYWQNEQTGKLREAVTAYLNNRIDGETVTENQIALLVEYIAYWVKAPCWDAPSDELQELRLSVEQLDTAEKVDEWIQKALDLGIDPL